MINSENQQYPKLNKARVKINHLETQYGKEAIEKEETVNISHSSP
jgi:hypothetical protein